MRTCLRSNGSSNSSCPALDASHVPGGDARTLCGLICLQGDRRAERLSDNYINVAVINVAVIGVGAFGRNHARIYHQLAQQGQAVRLVGVVDEDPARADAVAGEFGCRAFGSVEQLMTTHSEVQAASVAVPTRQHLEIARALMESGVDVLVEKPLAPSLQEGDEMIRLAQRP